jgi:hypothetical protein
MTKFKLRGWRRLRRNVVIKKGDRALYTDGSLSDYPIPSHEHGLVVGASGYFAVARPNKPQKHHE